MLSETQAALRRETFMREAAAERLATEARKVAGRARLRARGRFAPAGRDDRGLPRKNRRADRRSGRALRALETVPLFRGLGYRELALLDRLVDRFRFEEGAALASERHPQPQFVVLTKGVAEATLNGHRVAYLGPGDHFGELTVLDGAPHVPTITALTDVAGFVLGRPQFRDALRAIPQLGMRLATEIADDLRVARRRLSDPVPDPVGGHSFVSADR